MIKKICSYLIIAFSFVLIFSTAALAESMPANKNVVDGNTVSLVFEQSPVKTGNNNFTITVMDSNDKPVSGAQIISTFDMDSSKMDTMGMAAPVAVTLKEGKPGEYTGTIALTKKGDWMAKTVLKISGKDENIQFDFNVISTGPNWFIIGGFLGVIVLVILIALIVKSKKKKALNT